MTSNEIIRVTNALDYLIATKSIFSYTITKTEFKIDIPAIKYSNVYLKVPLIGKFSVQVFFPKHNIPDFEKIIKGKLKTGGKRNYKTIYLYESATVPSQTNIERIFVNAKVKMQTIGII